MDWRYGIFSILLFFVDCLIPFFKWLCPFRICSLFRAPSWVFYFLVWRGCIQPVVTDPFCLVWLLYDCHLPFLIFWLSYFYPYLLFCTLYLGVDLPCTSFCCFINSYKITPKIGVRPETGCLFTLHLTPRSEGFSRSAGNRTIFNLPLTYVVEGFSRSAGNRADF